MEEILKKILTKVEKIDEIKSQLDENTKILRMLEHKAELDKANINFANLSGEVKGVQKEVEDINENINTIEKNTNLAINLAASNRVEIIKLQPNINN